MKRFLEQGTPGGAAANAASPGSSPNHKNNFDAIVLFSYFIYYIPGERRSQEKFFRSPYLVLDNLI